MKAIIPENIRTILDKPGIYRFDESVWYWFFEVDMNKQVYQLNPRTWRRDGLLREDGWSENAKVGTVTFITKGLLK
jgi:hypothetical protein